MTGQNATPFQVWYEVQTADGKLMLVGWCQNNTPSPATLHYTATLKKDTTLIIRQNSTMSLPGQPIILLKAVFAIPDGIFDFARLEVYRYGERVAYTEIKGTSTASGLPLASEPTPPARPMSAFDELEVGGLILDETRSKLAHDFYELFYNHWSSLENPNLAQVNIVVREIPGIIGIGSRVVIEVNGQELSILNLQPRGDVLEQLALQLTEELATWLENPDNQYRELEAEDLSGTGVY